MNYFNFNTFNLQNYSGTFNLKVPVPVDRGTNFSKVPSTGAAVLLQSTVPTYVGIGLKISKISIAVSAGKSHIGRALVLSFIDIKNQTLDFVGRLIF